MTSSIPSKGSAPVNSHEKNDSLQLLLQPLHLEVPWQRLHMGVAGIHVHDGADD